MKHIALAAAIVASQLIAFSASAMEAVRAEVKADAASSVKAGAIPRGQGNVVTPSVSLQDRADVKMQARDAEKSGAIPKGMGNANVNNNNNQTIHTDSVTSRSQVKADTASAVKAGAIEKGQAYPAAK